MKTLFRNATIALALGSTALIGATPASAQERYRRHDNTGVAIIAGLAGLAIGAAIASSNDHHRDRYRDGRGYNGRYQGAVEPAYRQRSYRGYNGYRSYNGYQAYNGYQGYDGYQGYNGQGYDSYQRHDDYRQSYGDEGGSRYRDRDDD